jgi:hypothetical protein
VQRLTDMQSFGKVTARWRDRLGRKTMTSASCSPHQHSGKGSRRLTQSDTLRVFASVPQSYASSVKLASRRCSPCRFPGKTFPGKVTRFHRRDRRQHAHAPMQIDLPNPATLWAGMYGQVKLTITPDRPRSSCRPAR